MRARAATTTLILLVASLSFTPTGNADAPAGHFTICYNDRDGECETNIFITPTLHPMLGDYIVCDTHILTNVAGSAVCPNTAPGVRYECAPTAGGYCNSTILNWDITRYELSVTATVGSASLKLGTFGSEQYNILLDSVFIQEVAGTSTYTLAIPIGTHALKVVAHSAATPGETGSPPSTGGGGGGGGGGSNSGGSGDPSVIVALPVEGALAENKLAKAIFLIMGAVLVFVGQPSLFAYVGAKKYASRKSKPWITVLGISLVGLSLVSLAAT